MPRKPQIKVASPLEAGAQQSPQLPEQIPLYVVQGIIRGLLNHCWNKDRRPAKERDIDERRLERHLVDFAANIHPFINQTIKPEYERWAQSQENPPDFISCSIEAVASQVGEVFFNLRGHSPFMMVCGYDRIIEKIVTRYPGKAINPCTRLVWLKEHLPGILKDVKSVSDCTMCRRITKIPNEDLLLKMAYIKQPGQLAYAILGYFHGIEPATVKRLLSELPPPPSSTSLQ